jgi:hypothetical protein
MDAFKCEELLQWHTVHASAWRLQKAQHDVIGVDSALQKRCCFVVKVSQLWKTIVHESTSQAQDKHKKENAVRHRFRHTVFVTLIEYSTGCADLWPSSLAAPPNPPATPSIARTVEAREGNVLPAAAVSSSIVRTASSDSGPVGAVAIEYRKLE